MDFTWSKYLFRSPLKQKGQSTVEYIMLFAMVAILVTSVFKSDSFQKIFGKQGTFAKTYKEEIEFSYRHALRGRQQFSQPNYSSSHMSYTNGGTTRFFGARDAYPAQ